MDLLFDPGFDERAGLTGEQPPNRLVCSKMCLSNAWRHSSAIQMDWNPAAAASLT